MLRNHNAWNCAGGSIISFCILASPSGFRRPLVSDARMILMKAADEAGECLVRVSELSRLSICVFPGHHGTCPFKCDLHIQYAFRYNMSLILLECLATNFVAWISKRVNLGCEEERRLRFAASGRRDEDHHPGRGRGPYKKAISTSHDS